MFLPKETRNIPSHSGIVELSTPQGLVKCHVFPSLSDVQLLSEVDQVPLLLNRYVRVIDPPITWDSNRRLTCLIGHGFREGNIHRLVGSEDVSSGLVGIKLNEWLENRGLDLIDFFASCDNSAELGGARWDQSTGTDVIGVSGVEIYWSFQGDRFVVDLQRVKKTPWIGNPFLRQSHPKHYLVQKLFNSTYKNFKVKDRR